MKNSASEKYGMKKHSTLYGLIIAMVLLFCVITMVKLQIETNRLEAEKTHYEALNEELRDMIDEYTNELETPKDDAYYEKKAREKLNLRLPDEIVFYNDLVN